LVKAGCREAAGRLFKKINLLISTTPALCATPPHLRRGILARFQFIHTFYDRAQFSGRSYRATLMHTNTAGLKTVAIFEALKGDTVLVEAIGVVSLVHEGAQVVVEEIVRNFHLNPASRYPRIFLDAINSLNSTRLWLLAAGALLYVSVRFVEAYGLWHELTWAEWLGAISGSIYLPIEIYEFILGVTIVKAVLFFANLAIVAFLGRTLYLDRRSRNLSSNKLL
jgi:uncharacterized membrane protein (DUF2068 family)